MDIEKGSQVLDGLSLVDVHLARGGRSLIQKLFLEINSGAAIALKGGNGTGKTTLLRAVAGLVSLDSGRIDFRSDGDVMDTLEARRTGVHLLGHQEGLKPTRTAMQELKFQCGYLGGSKDGLDRAIDVLNLEPLLDLETRRLSAGQKRRISMARLISAPRPLWLLDEPLSPLDSDWRQRVGVMMQDHLANGGMMIAAVHDPLPVSATLLDLGEYL